MSSAVNASVDALVSVPNAATAVPGAGRQLLRRVVAEFIGTALLLIAVVGSGIAAQSLSPTDTGLALLENAIATGAALAAIILAVGSVSGAHLNPVVSCADAMFRGLKLPELIAYIVAQVAGGCAGVVVANLMFSLPAVTISSHMRSSSSLWLAEVVATFGLLLVIFGVTRGGRSEVAPFADHRRRQALERGRDDGSSTTTTPRAVPVHAQFRAFSDG